MQSLASRASWRSLGACPLIPSEEVRDRGHGGHVADITSLSRFIGETLNCTPNRAAPYVGASAFAHKGGLHVSAIERSPDSYQHVKSRQRGQSAARPDQ